MRSFMRRRRFATFGVEAAGESACAIIADALLDLALERRTERLAGEGAVAVYDQGADTDVHAAHATLRGLDSESGRSSLAASRCAARRRCGIMIGSPAAAAMKAALRATLRIFPPASCMRANA